MAHARCVCVYVLIATICWGLWSEEGGGRRREWGGARTAHTIWGAISAPISRGVVSGQQLIDKLLPLQTYIRYIKTYTK